MIGNKGKSAFPACKRAFAHVLFPDPTESYRRLAL